MIIGDQKAQVLGKECCCNNITKTMKKLGYKGVETSLEQCRWCSHCCSNPRAMTHWISRAITKRLRYEVSKNRGYVLHTFGCPNSEL